MLKRVWWCSAIVLLLIVNISVVFADWNVQVVPIEDKIFADQEAKFDLYFSNNNTYDDEYKMDIGSVRGWSLFSEPLQHLEGINVKRRNVTKTTVILKADSDVYVGLYNLSLHVTSLQTDESRTYSLITYVRDPAMVLKGYTPALNVDVLMPEPIDPRQELVIRVNLWNRNRLNISKLTLNIESALFKNNRTTSLEPLEKKTEEFHVALNPQEHPGMYPLFVSFDIGENRFTPLQRIFTISAYEDIKSDVKEDSFLFKKIEAIHLKNAGNVPKRDTVKVPTGIFESLFTSTTPESTTIKQTGVRYYTFNYELQPNEELTIAITTNYRPLILMIILVLGSIIVYYTLRSSLIIHKESKAIEAHDGMSTVKILLHVKNRSAHVIENVTIVDAIPSLAHLVGGFPLGTLQPEKVIKNEEKGTLIKWHLSLLESFEERILVYTIASRLKIIGHVRLPSAIVKFKTQRGAFAKIKSNNPLAGRIRILRKEKKSIY